MTTENLAFNPSHVQAWTTHAHAHARRPRLRAGVPPHPTPRLLTKSWAFWEAGLCLGSEEEAVPAPCPADSSLEKMQDPDFQGRSPLASPGLSPGQRTLGPSVHMGGGQPGAGGSLSGAGPATLFSRFVY